MPLCIAQELNPILDKLESVVQNRRQYMRNHLEEAKTELDNFGARFGSVMVSFDEAIKEFDRSGNISANFDEDQLKRKCEDLTTRLKDLFVLDDELNEAVDFCMTHALGPALLFNKTRLVSFSKDFTVTLSPVAKATWTYLFELLKEHLEITQLD